MNPLDNLYKQFTNNDTFPSISAEQAVTIIKNEAVTILDVRTEGEFNGPLSHLEGAVLIPVEELADRVNEVEEFKDKKMLVVCKAGHRSKNASRFLSEKGFSNIVEIDSGMVGVSALQDAPLAGRN